jgi:hypothetical protein
VNKDEVRFTLDRKEAKLLMKAMLKGEWNKLTKPQADALDNFLTELLIEVGP